MKDTKSSGDDRNLPSPDLAKRRLIMATAGGAAASLTIPAWGALNSSAGTSSSDTPLHYTSLLDVAQRIRAGDLRPTAVTQMQLDRIAAIDPGLHSYVTVMADEAMEQARQADAEIVAGAVGRRVPDLEVGRAAGCVEGCGIGAERPVRRVDDRRQNVAVDNNLKRTG